MNYTTNTPLDSQIIKDTQPTIKENFQSTFNFVGIDHNDVNTINAGKHKQVTFTPQNDLEPITIGESRFVNTLAPSTGDYRLAYINTDAVGAIRTVYWNAAKNDGNATGWTQLPSGAYHRWMKLDFDGTELLIPIDLRDGNDDFPGFDLFVPSVSIMPVASNPSECNFAVFIALSDNTPQTANTFTLYATKRINPPSQINHNFSVYINAWGY